mmetsp:Transcript_17212/g.48012  ORF Transcript_17212/g.48012 Transcript_17212/m.48012 type:complete len:208 (-) Transcript_17212:1811-2434(-)
MNPRFLCRKSPPLLLDEHCIVGCPCFGVRHELVQNSGLMALPHRLNFGSRGMHDVLVLTVLQKSHAVLVGQPRCSDDAGHVVAVLQHHAPDGRLPDSDHPPVEVLQPQCHKHFMDPIAVIFPADIVPLPHALDLCCRHMLLCAVAVVVTSPVRLYLNGSGFGLPGSPVVEAPPVALDLSCSAVKSHGPVLLHESQPTAGVDAPDPCL